jgi:hypothetical protein
MRRRSGKKRTRNEDRAVAVNIYSHANSISHVNLKTMRSNAGAFRQRLAKYYSMSRFGICDAGSIPLADRFKLVVADAYFAIPGA